MPSNVVKTKADEKKWDKAQELAAEAGHKEEWAYIMGIYKKMKPDHFKKKGSDSLPGEAGMDSRNEADDELQAGIREEVEEEGSSPELAKARAQQNLDEDERFYKNKKQDALTEKLSARHIARRYLRGKDASFINDPDRLPEVGSTVTALDLPLEGGHPAFLRTSDGREMWFHVDVAPVDEEDQADMADMDHPAEALAFKYAAQATRWKVYIFSDKPNAKPLWTKEFMAVKGKEQHKALGLVKPHLDKFEDAEDWVVEEVKGKAGGASSDLPFDRKTAYLEMFKNKSGPPNPEETHFLVLFMEGRGYVNNKQNRNSKVIQHLEGRGFIHVVGRKWQVKPEFQRYAWAAVNRALQNKKATNQKVIESPHNHHPVKLEPPKAKRKVFPFEGYIDFQGIKIDVENKKGSVRRGEGPEGKWETKMYSHYGEIRGTEGTDGDKLDTYVGSNHDSSIVVVVHQHNPWDGKFDEDKVMLGFNSIEEAIGAYKVQYDRPGFYKDGEHTAMPLGQFWRWVTDARKKGKKVTGGKVAGTIMFPASMLKSGTNEYTTAGWWREFNPSGLSERAWAKTVEFSEPIRVNVFSDGNVLFSDGHHRAMAGKILGQQVPITIGMNKMKPHVWKAFLGLVRKGVTLREINPEGYNLNSSVIPSFETVVAGRRSGLRDEALTQFYMEREANRNSRNAAGAGTDTGSLIAIDPGQLAQVTEAFMEKWNADEFEDANTLIREHGGAVFNTGGDGDWDVKVEGAVESKGYTAPYGTPEFGKKTAFDFDRAFARMAERRPDLVPGLVDQGFLPAPKEAAGMSHILDANAVKQLKQDMRRLTKIYKSVPTSSHLDYSLGERVYDDPKWEEKWEDARKILRTFRTNLETWVYKVLIPTATGKEDKRWTQKLLREKAWTFLTDLGHYEMFPTQWDSRTDKNEKAPWKLDKKRATNIRRYQKSYRALIEALDDMIQYEGTEGTLERPEEFYKTQLAGMNVVIHTKGMEGRDAGHEAFLRDLRRQTQQIQQAGFSKGLKGLTLHLSFDRSDLTAGQYNWAKDELYVFPLGMVAGKNEETFIHEVGHRFYFRALSGRARSHWEQILKGRGAKVERADVEKYMSLYQKVKYPDRKSLKQMVERAKVDPETLAKFKYLADHDPAFTRDLGEIRKFHMEVNVGEDVQIEKITDYGATNPKEAFAEAFQLYVRFGPRKLGPWTRHFFEMLTRSGRTAAALPKHKIWFHGSRSFTGALKPMWLTAHQALAEMHGTVHAFQIDRRAEWYDIDEYRESGPQVMSTMESIGYDASDTKKLRDAGYDVVWSHREGGQQAYILNSRVLRQNKPTKLVAGLFDDIFDGVDPN